MLLTAESKYPQTGFLSCQILYKNDKIIAIDISSPLGIETESGKSVFEVFEDQIILYEDWKDFFSTKLLKSGLFHLTQTLSRGDADVEIYSALKGNLNTKIEVGFFSRMTLIYINIVNPETPGKNRQQEIEHLDKYEFDAEKQYGPPGLDFNEINLQGINNYLDEGFNGNETVYYRNGKPIKSKLTTSYYPNSQKSSITYHFNEGPLYKKLLNKILGRGNNYDQIKHIDLQNIFSGLSQLSKSF